MKYRWIRSKTKKGTYFYTKGTSYDNIAWEGPYAKFSSQEIGFIVYKSWINPIGRPSKYEFPEDLKLVIDKKRYIESIFRLEGFMDGV